MDKKEPICKKCKITLSEVGILEGEEPNCYCRKCLREMGRENVAQKLRRLNTERRSD